MPRAPIPSPAPILVAALLALGALLAGCAPVAGEVDPRPARPDADLRRDSAAVLTVRLIPLRSRIGGLSVLISDSSSATPRYLLVDGGDDERHVAGVLRELGVDTLALVVLTHPHADHYAGLTGVLRDLPVRAFAWNGDTRTLASFHRMLTAVDSSGAATLFVEEVPRTVWVRTGEDSLEVVLLPPTPRALLRGGDRINNRSVGVRIVRGSFTVLVPGDAEHQQLDWWSRTYPDLVRATILVASHHGSDDANATARRPQWYRTVTPAVLLVSANGRQHPYANVLAFAQENGVRTYCTHTHGAVAVRLLHDGSWATVTERDAPCTPGAEAPR